MRSDDFPAGTPQCLVWCIMDGCRDPYALSFLPSSTPVTTTDCSAVDSKHQATNFEDTSRVMGNFIVHFGGTMSVDARASTSPGGSPTDTSSYYTTDQSPEMSPWCVSNTTGVKT